MERNELYPVFLKVPQLNILIEGGDNLAEEKLTFLLKSRPRANLEMVSQVLGSYYSTCQKIWNSNVFGSIRLELFAMESPGHSYRRYHFGKRES
ncbi:hypothetical protein [Maribacter cobaltidurans]|uniref:hypothetical protein n=1 Tax=Maribacter TaxID=252356 RepID=UPI003AF33FC0